MSEVARLRQQIELECQALRRFMTEYATVARHDVINHRFEAITPLQSELSGIVGEAEATRITVEAYIAIVG